LAKSASASFAERQNLTVRMQMRRPRASQEDIVPFDFDDELSKAIAHYEDRFGERDKRFHILPVAFHGRPYAQSIVDDHQFTVAVRLNVAAQHHDLSLKYQLWHEAVHCLAPVNSMRTLWFEEGLAVQCCMYAPPINRQYRKATEPGLKRHRDWYDPWQAFKKLKATDEQIRTIHERAPERKFDLITQDLLIDVFEASQELADTLCCRLGDTRA
jgi:hypothetical protein